MLDSTDPAQVRALEVRSTRERHAVHRLEQIGRHDRDEAMMDYFHDRVSKTIGADKAGSRFIAITDPSSRCTTSPTDQGFPHLFYGDPTISPRYSVLSPRHGAGSRCRYGRAQPDHEALAMVHACAADVPPMKTQAYNSALTMGLAEASRPRQGDDTPSDTVVDPGAWDEQLIAESTGKDDKGVIAIDGESIGDPRSMARSLFIDIRTEGEDDAR